MVDFVGIPSMDHSSRPRCHDMNPMDPPKKPSFTTVSPFHPKPSQRFSTLVGGGPEGGGVLYLGTLEVSSGSLEVQYIYIYICI